MKNQIKFIFKYKFIIFIFILLQFKIVRSNIMNKILEVPNNIIKLLPFKVLNENIIPDIVICPGGRYGSYQAGICHYIKNNFNITNKKIVGFSAGAWNAVFMASKKEYDNEFLKKLFKINLKKLKHFLKEAKKIIETYDITEYNIQNVYIGVSTLNGLAFYNKFITIQDVTRCCTASSFIPYLTYNDAFYFYKNRLSLDGAFHCKKYLDTLSSNTLIIKYNMFGRYKNMNIFKENIKKYKPSAYELYMKGYHDAIYNHEYLKQFF